MVTVWHVRWVCCKIFGRTFSFLKFTDMVIPVLCVFQSEFPIFQYLCSNFISLKCDIRFTFQVLSVELDLWLWASGIQCPSLQHHRTLSIYYWLQNFSSISIAVLRSNDSFDFGIWTFMCQGVKVQEWNYTGFFSPGSEYTFFRVQRLNISCLNSFNLVRFLWFDLLTCYIFFNGKWWLEKCLFFLLKWSSVSCVFYCFDCFHDFFMVETLQQECLL